MKTHQLQSRLPRWTSWLLGAALAISPALTRAEAVLVAVAANFATPMRKIADSFERATGKRVIIVLGSTGSLYAQTKNGAPFHLLLAADETTPLRLEQEGLAVQETRKTYAVGRIALWSPTPGRVDDQGAALRKMDFARLAVANPKLAPYGRAAQQVIEGLGLATVLRDKLVLGESVGQAYQFAASGAADMGFVALAQVMQDGRLARGSAWIVPAALHNPIRQDLVLLNAGSDRPGARALHAFVLGPTAQAIIHAHGYAP